MACPMTADRISTRAPETARELGSLTRTWSAALGAGEVWATVRDAAARNLAAASTRDGARWIVIRSRSFPCQRRDGDLESERSPGLRGLSIHQVRALLGQEFGAWIWNKNL